MTFLISSNTKATCRFNLGVDFTIFKVKELENKEGNDVPLARDLASDCDVTISVTFCISSNTNATDSILVSILPYSRLKNSRIRKEMMCRQRVT